MPKKIEVLSRTLPYENKLLGKGGLYTVSDVFAKQAVVEGKAKVVENLGDDATPLALDKRIDFEFMSKVKHHAPEIMKILEGEFERQREERLAADKYQEELAHLPPQTDQSGESLKDSEEDQSSSASTAAGSESGKTEEISTSSEKLSPIDEPEGIVTTADNSSIEPTDSIPEDFPGFTALTKKGVTTMTQLSALGYDDLIELGIRQGTANQIGAKLAELMESKKNNA